MSEFSCGDKVVVTLEGLQEHSRSTPAHMGYTRETMSWRRTLSGLKDSGEAGTVVRTGEDLTVDWPSRGLVGLPSYMVKKAD